MLLKEKVDAYLANNGWSKYVDDDDVDFYQAQDKKTEVVYPEDKLAKEKPAEYERLKKEALETVAKYEGISVDALIKKI